MYAIIESCGKQYKVVKGDLVFFEKLDVEEGKKITFDKVILTSDDSETKIGDPYVKGASVTGKVIAHGKHKKIIVFKFKAKKNYRRKQGHRQPYTKVEITEIKLAGKTETAKEEVVEKKELTKTAEIKKPETSAKKKTTTAKTITSKVATAKTKTTKASTTKVATTKKATTKKEESK